MTFYFLLEGEDRDHVKWDANTLGTSTPKTFYPDRGLKRLMNISEHFPELLEKVVIYRDGTTKKYTVQEFLDTISKLIIIQH